MAFANLESRAASSPAISAQRKRPCHEPPGPGLFHELADGNDERDFRGPKLGGSGERLSQRSALRFNSLWDLGHSCFSLVPLGWRTCALPQFQIRRSPTADYRYLPAGSLHLESHHLLLD